MFVVGSDQVDGLRTHVLEVGDHAADEVVLEVDEFLVPRVVEEGEKVGVPAQLGRFLVRAPRGT